MLDYLHGESLILPLTPSSFATQGWRGRQIIEYRLAILNHFRLTALLTRFLADFNSPALLCFICCLH